MQTPVQVTFRDMPVSDAVEAMCWNEAAKLDRFFDGIIGCHITVAESHHRRRKGNLFDIRINLSVPGRELVVNREPAAHHVDEEITVAIPDAFARMRRRLQDYASRLHEHVNKHDRAVEH